MRPTRHSDIVYALVQSPATMKLLVVKNRGGTWSLPGGKREPGETLQEAAFREVQEEAGAEVGIGPLVYVSEAEYKGRFATFFVFRCELQPDAKIAPGPEIEAIAWSSRAEAEQLMPWYRGQMQAMIDGWGVVTRDEFPDEVDREHEPALR